ncbi:MAG: dioxygenase family protein [Phenylobacterium sp.]
MADAERLKAIHARTVEKLKDVVREFKITQDELHLAGDFFDRLGKAGMTRSLIDVSLAMTSVDVTSPGGGGTRPNLEGPFRGARPLRPDGDLVDGDPGPDAPRLTLTGVIRDAATGAPIPGAELHVWQADHHGHYDNQGDTLRGRIRADAAGRYLLKTLVPRDYADHDDDPIGELYRAMGRHNRRAAHIHIKVFVADKELLTTQLFMPDSEYLETDYVEGAVSPDLTLQLHADPAAKGGAIAYTAEFDFSVAGAPSPVAAE